MDTATIARRMLDRNGILYPLMLVAALAVIVYSVLGVAALTGVLPRLQGATTDPAAPGGALSKENCGTVNFVAPAENAGRRPTYRVHVRVDDGSYLTVIQHQVPAAAGERVSVSGESILEAAPGCVTPQPVRGARSAVR